MSARLPLQSKAIRPKFENRKAAFGNDDDDDEDRVIEERVIGIENNQIREAVPKKKAAPLVITPLPNADLRANAKQKKDLYIPPQPQQSQTVDIKPELLEQTAAYGLQIQKKEKVEIKVEETTEIVQETVIEEEAVPKTLEERAIEAIKKAAKGEIDTEEDQGPKKVIPALETLAFRDDYKTRPEDTTMDDYDRVPVEEFGAALLRGLGWNEGEGIGRNRKNAPPPPPTEVKQREALLGLGAKPSQIDFKNDKERSKNRREAYVYKDTSLFKKISKRKFEENSNSSRESSSSSKRRSRSSDRHRSRRSRSRSTERHRSRRSRSRSSERHRSRRRSRSSDRYRKSRRDSSRSRSPDSRSSKGSRDRPSKR